MLKVYLSLNDAYSIIGNDEGKSHLLPIVKKSARIPTNDFVIQLSSHHIAKSYLYYGSTIDIDQFVHSGFRKIRKAGFYAPRWAEEDICRGSLHFLHVTIDELHLFQLLHRDYIVAIK